MRRTTLLTLALLALASPPALSDAYRMEGDRYADGPVTVLTLSDEQLVTVRTKRFLVLTDEQKHELFVETGVAPTALQVHSLRIAGKDCTCFEYNIAIWFEERRVEAPHAYLVSDEEAARRMDHLDRLWAGEEADPAEPSNR